MAAKEIIATGLLSLALLSGCGEDKPAEAPATPAAEAPAAAPAADAAAAPAADAAAPAAK